MTSNIRGLDALAQFGADLRAQEAGFRNSAEYIAAQEREIANRKARERGELQRAHNLDAMGRPNRWAKKQARREQREIERAATEIGISL